MAPIAGLLLVAAVQTATPPHSSYDDARSVYSALRTQPHISLSIGGGTVDVVFADDAPGLDRVPVMKWIRSSADAATTYFGRLAVMQVGILVIASEGANISGGTTYGFESSAIRIVVGRSADDTAFKNDWVLVHEMTHLALPDVPRPSNWLLEGNATYIEPIARAQAGQLDPAEVWRWSIDGMRKGLPGAGDQGLDNTPTWGRIYWGGALFWLRADIAIRQRTQNRLSVQDALRAINRKSGGNTGRWSVERVVAVGDQTTGTDVLTTLYSEARAAAVPTDLDLLFSNLGVHERQGKIVFDDQAPLAAIRRQITQLNKPASQTQ